jgi:hypothetical protein
MTATKPSQQPRLAMHLCPNGYPVHRTVIYELGRSGS